VVFDPAGRCSDPEILNLWLGFAVRPHAGSWDLLKSHIRGVICNNDPVVFAYLLDWMADLVQRPAYQGEVAVVLRGQEGCGKGTLAKALKYLLGQHGFAISNARHLTGNFNSHLRDVVFLFADEAFIAGERAHIGVLKALITEPYLTIEGKYQNAVQTPNFLHVIMASNEDWVVPASLKSRRWLVLDVPGHKIGDHAYFAAIYRELEHGGYRAMLDELLKRDISKSNLRAVPVTEALQTQRKRSVDTITAWWLDCLHRAYVFESKLGLEEHWAQWHEFLPTEVLFASYIRSCRDRHERYPLSRELFGKWMGEIAKPGRMRNQATGEHMVDTMTDGRPRRVAELIMRAKPYGYSIGALDEARLSFSSKCGLAIEWELAETC
jgi:phage/plasmid-associated DNA primase